MENINKKRVLVVGHGYFGSCLKSVLGIVVGGCEDISYIDFTEEKSPRDLKNEIESVLKENNNPTYILTDILGGTPFKLAIDLKEEYSNIDIEVITGTNVPMLMELALSLNCNLDIDLPSLLQIGSNSVYRYTKNTKVDEVDNDLDEGI